MALPNNTATVLTAAFSTAHPLDDFRVRNVNGVISIDAWDAVAIGSAQPSEQQINDWSTDAAALPATAGPYAGRLFSEWLAEHGGDPAPTARRLAKEAFDLANQRSESLVRAVVLVLIDEINLLRAQHLLPPRTKAQARTAIRNKLDSGDADG